MKYPMIPRLVLVGVLLVGLAPVTYAQRDYGRARGLVAQADADLRKVSNRERFSEKERERYDNALRHLSEFDQDLSRSKYHEDKLDQAIEDLNNTCKNNTLSPGERDILQADLRSLRELPVDWKK